eukprot:scaffold14757_cov111-Isochrysis_galbana.AAC.5
MRAPSLCASRPFSAKHQSKSVGESPSCSFCFTKSEPPTTPMAILSRRALRKSRVSGDTTLRGSVRVPSTSNSASIRAFLPIGAAKRVRRADVASEDATTPSPAASLH